MPYLGTPPQSGFITSDSEKITGQTTNYVNLSNAISSLDDVQVHVNYVIQDPSTLTFTSTTRIGLGDTLVSSDVVLITYLGKSVATQSPPVGGVSLDMLSATGTKSSSTFLAGDNSFKTVSGTTINNNADNRVITGSGTANTLEGEQNLIFSATGELALTSSDSASNTQTLKVATTGNANPAYANLVFKSGGNTSGCWIKGIQASGGNDGRLQFHTNNAGTVTEAMRIMYNGKVCIPDSTDSGRIEIVGGSSDPYILMRGPTTGTTTKVMFLVNGSEVGTINTTSSSTQYNTSSDYRLKENEVAISDGIERLKQLKPYRFNFKVDADTTVDGFFAHEVTPVVPEAISGTKDAMDPEVLYTDKDELPEGKKIGDVKEATKINPQAIDQSKLVPLLTSALQEAITKIETLEARVKTLEDA